MDIEGLCAADGYLWIVGSHSLKRCKPKRDESEDADALRRMEKIEREANRYFLGRIPLVEEAAGPLRARPLGRRTTGRLGQVRKAAERARPLGRRRPASRSLSGDPVQGERLRRRRPRRPGRPGLARAAWPGAAGATP